MNVIPNQKFGRLMAIKKNGFILVGKYQEKWSAWDCICECGKKVRLPEQSLKRGNTKSCGCLWVDSMKKVHVTHGHTISTVKSSEYCAWSSMKQRCLNQNGRFWKWYGGKGIKICKRWENSFENFLNDVGQKPSSKHSLGRKNNDGNYTPSNCRWETRREQSRNTSRTVYILIGRKKKKLMDLCDDSSVRRYTLLYRLKHGVPEVIAKTAPPIAPKSRMLFAKIRKASKNV